MRRLHLFEFTDLQWYPKTFRRMQTDYLQFVATRGSAHQHLVPLLKKALRHSGTAEIVDLCSGGTGPWLRLQEKLRADGQCVKITLTDKYPDPAAVHKWELAQRQDIDYLAEPVDAMSVPAHLGGVRTLFEGFHHFGPDQARCILQDAVDAGVPIGVFEASLRPPLGLLFLPLMPLLTLAGYLLSTPFIRPVTFSRFFWTYLVPVVPLVTCWDGVVSLLRVYSLADLRSLTGSLDCVDYTWESGQTDLGVPVFAYTYLLGLPAGTPSPKGDSTFCWTP